MAVDFTNSTYSGTWTITEHKYIYDITNLPVILWKLYTKIQGNAKFIPTQNSYQIMVVTEKMFKI